MGQGRPSGASYGAAHATIDLDLTALTSAPRVAQAAGEATAKALQQSLKIVQNEQKVAITNAQAALAAMRGQQEQATATAKGESAARIAQSRAEAAVLQQQARAATASTIEEQRRQTAAFKQELKERDRAQRQQSQVSGSSFGQNAASFAGAAFGGPIGGLAGALAGGSLPIAAGLAVNQGARFAVDAAQTATAYNRQEVAARSLAGSQGKLNALMVAYDQASGGAVDKATELARVTTLEATGFAKSAEGVREFVTGTRGAALALGKSQEYIGEETQLAIVNQSKRRLDQIGLGVDEVTKRIDTLSKANKSLTSEQAFSQAVIGLLSEKYGALTNSIEGQATGLEHLSKAWKNFQLAIGQATGPGTNAIGGGLASEIDGITKRIEELTRAGQNVGGAVTGQKGPSSNAPDWAHVQPAFKIWADRQDAAMDAWLSHLRGVMSQAEEVFVTSSASRDVGRHAGSQATGVRFTDDQESALVDWNTKRVAIERESQAAVVAEARSWGNQRLEAERAYTKTSVREAQDWATQQSRTQEDYQESQAKNEASFTKQQAREERDLGRSIAREQAEDAEKVADIRKDSSKRLADIEEDYADQRAKAARDHSDNLLDAAGNLDAKAVYQEQRKYAEQLQDSQKAHDKQVKENKSQLQERLDDERKSLDKSISQQRTALDEQEADQKADYDERNQDAQAQFTKEKARAEQDRGVRLGRMGQDQQDQLDAIDRAHFDRMADIAQRTQDEKKAIETILTDANIAVKGFVDTSVDDAIEAYDKYYTHMDDVLSGRIKPGDAANQGIPATRSSPAGFASGGWVQRGGMARVHTGEFVMPAPAAKAMASGGGRSVHFGDIHITVAGGTNMGRDELKYAVREAMIEAYEEAA